MKMKLLLLLLLIPLASADKQGSIVLLTVAEQNGNMFGATADLFLEVKAGSGRIFIDSFPLTKLDTQVSTRFANQIVCQELEIDCSRYDFFYRIRADSTIVGGASAGTGIALLTAAVMKDIPIDETVAVTGTMNSGGVIGPVAGVYEKVAASEERGMTKVIIPRWFHFNETEYKNKTGKNLSIEVVEVANLDEAIEAYSGRNFNIIEGEIEIRPEYTDRMRAVSDILCSRADKILESIDYEVEGQKNFTRRKEKAYNDSHYYTAASYCFTRNLILRSALLEDTSNINNVLKVRDLSKSIGKLDKKLEETELETLSDLETYMVVKERLVDAAQSLAKLELANVSTDGLSYVIERYFSSIAWTNFFGLGGKPLVLDNEHLESACNAKILEAEERIDYLRSANPLIFTEASIELRLAYNDRTIGNYPLCIFKAIKAKAEANMFLMAMMSKEENLPKIIEEKLEATKRVILKQKSFPILGYSYYEYASSLKDTVPMSALLFSEYSLEMSNLELYFPSDEINIRFPIVDPWLMVLFASGFFLGFGTAIFLVKHSVSLKKARRK